MGLLQRTDIKLAHLQAKALFMADPVAMTPAGSRTLDQAVDECVLTAIYDTILSDVSTPRIIWIESPPHSWFGHGIGGARYFNDNPDCAIRAASLDPLGRYEIHGRAGSVRQAALSFQLYHDNAYGLVIPGVPSRSPLPAKNSTRPWAAYSTTVCRLRPTAAIRSPWTPHQPVAAPTISRLNRTPVRC
ncbi:MAG: hypothetical protein IPJ33_20585 [Gammaproteobacteria bacterium]|nr:hypothetical protein [Gammaproteobacteria bacterium]